MSKVTHHFNYVIGWAIGGYIAITGHQTLARMFATAATALLLLFAADGVAWLWKRYVRKGGV